jgi:hypothetical protein
VIISSSWAWNNLLQAFSTGTFSVEKESKRLTLAHCLIGLSKVKHLGTPTPTPTEQHENLDLQKWGAASENATEECPASKTKRIGTLLSSLRTFRLAQNVLFPYHTSASCTHDVL